MKYLILFIVLTCSVLLSAQTVARVGDFEISQQELAEEMESFADRDDLTYKQVRQMALDNLIENYILISYAADNNIAVDNVELEAFFMRELGDLPRFQTDGNFSVAKYRVFMETPNGKTIKQEMEKEILINKTRTLIQNSFNIADEQLLKQYLLEKISIDLGYAIIDVTDADVTKNISLQEALKFYQKNKSKYVGNEKIKLEFFLIFKDKFSEEIQIPVEERLQKIAEMDTTLLASDLDKMRSVFKLEETTHKALEEAQTFADLWSTNSDLNVPVLKSAYLEVNDELGNIPNSIIQTAFQMEVNEISQPYDIGEAVIVFQVTDHRQYFNKNEDETANLVWKDFLEITKKNFSDYQEFFDNNIDLFSVDVAVVNIVNISKPPRFSSISKSEFVENIRSSIQANIDDPYKVQQVLQKNGLETNHRILYLETFKNDSIMEDVIAQMIAKNSSYGFLPSSDGLVFFQVLSYFPNYIPRFEDIRSQMPDLIAISQTDTTEFRSYFESHKKDFMSPDSLKIGGVLFAIDTIADTLQIEISESEIEDIYSRDIDSYYRKRSVQFDYIFVKSKQEADLIQNYLLQGISFALLKFSFHKKHDLNCSDPVQYDDLPRVIRESLSRMLEGSIYQPVEYDNGWFILNKIREIPAGIIPYEEIKPEIENDLRNLYAEETAYLAAKSIFDSTSYFSHLFKYFDDKDIFETEYQDINDDFAVLGSLKEYKNDLMRIWRNEKFSSIIRTEEGFAVIFVLKKHAASQQTFEESLPAIERIFAAKSQFENAKLFVNTLRDSVITGRNYEKLLKFFGGWKKAHNLTLSSKIPGLNFSEDIMTDILNRKENYCSPVITINNDQLLFYYIERYQKPDTTEFEANKAEFKQKFIQKKYYDWLSQNKAKLSIEIF